MSFFQTLTNPNDANDKKHQKGELMNFKGGFGGDEIVLSKNGLKPSFMGVFMRIDVLIYVTDGIFCPSSDGINKIGVVLGVEQLFYYTNYDLLRFAYGSERRYSAKRINKSAGEGVFSGSSSVKNTNNYKTICIPPGGFTQVHQFTF